ncbi:12248_t:CDS:2 [Entrophospora sp. SA101]|nr:12248_t:CDS:2 [Entrophospora sp. SA101]
MSKHKEVSPTLASQGIIDFNLYYGPFAHHWWHEISTENGSEFYPICLGMTILTELNNINFLLCIIMIRSKELIEESVHNTQLSHDEIPKKLRGQVLSSS